MALQIISVVLFTVFFPGALTLTCYNCTTDSNGVCPQTANCSGTTQCSFVTTTIYNHNSTSIKSCSDRCVNESIYDGWIRYTSQCCASDFCNSTAGTIKEKSCYACNDKYCSSYKTLNCKGVEDNCFTATDTSNGTIKGCVSNNNCNASMSIHNMYFNISNFVCCDGNLCNSAQSQAQAAVLLLVPVLPILFFI